MKTAGIKSELALMLATVALAFHVNEAMAQEYLPYAVMGYPSKTSPYFFGPSAFPIPDMAKNTSGDVKCQLNGDFSWGHLAPTTDYAATFGFDLRLPLWTDRANLCIYGQFHEWYWDTPEVRALRRVDPKYALNGNCAGDAYVSIVTRVLNERKYVPLTTLRIALKSASGDDYEKARYFDAPGYFFDLCFTKSFAFRNDAFFRSVNASFNFGFVCWQTDIGCQNDAWLLAGSLELDTKMASLSVDIGGYSGHENYYDSPLSVKARMDILPDRKFSPFVMYQGGLRDWPFNQVRAGVTYSINTRFGSGK